MFLEDNLISDEQPMISHGNRFDLFSQIVYYNEPEYDDFQVRNPNPRNFTDRPNNYEQQILHSFKSFRSERSYHNKDQRQSDTKNLPKFFGHLLRNFILETIKLDDTKLSTEYPAVYRFVAQKGSNSESRTNAYYNIQEFDLLFQDKFGSTLAIAYFGGQKAIKDVLLARRIKDRKSTIKYIRQFLKGAKQRRMDHLK